MGKINRTFLKRKGRITKHHDKNKCKGGTKEEKNIILLIEERHQCWHIIFHNRTFLEAARLLLRVHNMKNKTNLKITKR